MSNQIIAAGGISELTSEPHVSQSKHIPSPQSRRSGQLIVKMGELLNTVTNDPELAAVMGAAGYGTDRIAEGRQLCENAHARYLDRQAAMGRQNASAVALNHAFADALAAYREARAVGL